MIAAAASAVGVSEAVLVADSMASVVSEAVRVAEWDEVPVQYRVNICCMIYSSADDPR